MPSWLLRQAILSLTIVVGLSSFLPGIARAEATDALTTPTTETVIDAPVTEPVVTETPPADPVVSEPVAETSTEQTTEPTEEESADPTIEEAVKDFTNIVQQTTEYTCGPAALGTLILLKDGVITDEMQIAEASSTTEDNGTSMLGLKKAADKLGYVAKVKRWNMSALQKATLPVLVNDKAPDGSAHYSVVLGFTDTGVKLADTKLGNIEFDLEDFAKSYTGMALTISPKQTISNGMSIDAVANIIAANPDLGAIVFDENGKVIPADQLDDVYDDEAASVTGKGGVISYAIPVSQLSFSLSTALLSFGVTTITIVTSVATGEIVAIIGVGALGVYLGAKLINTLFNSIEKIVAKLVKARAVPKATTITPDPSSGDCGPNGGTYKLIDALGQVAYAGRTDDLNRRKLEHAKTTGKENLRFEIDKKTNNCDAQRGREQQLWDKYKPLLNKIRPISLDNPNLKKYIDVAIKYLGNIK